MGDTSESVRTFLDGATPAKRRRDAETLLDLMARATGQSPQLYYGTGIGYGRYHYKYKSGREGMPRRRASHRERPPRASTWSTALGSTRSS